MIEVKNLSKVYKMYSSPAERVKEAGMGDRHTEEFQKSSSCEIQS